MLPDKTVTRVVNISRGIMYYTELSITDAVIDAAMREGLSEYDAHQILEISHILHFARCGHWMAYNV